MIEKTSGLSKQLHESGQLAGLIPCAGYAKRISPLPCSKEIYPVGFHNNDPEGLRGPKVISSYLLERLSAAGTEIAYMIIRKEKWDIPDYYVTGEKFGIHLSYIVVHPTQGSSFTIDKAYPFIREKRVLFGFPDIYFEPGFAYQKLLKHQNETGSDVVLGLFNACNPQNVDMVELDNEKNVRKIIIKPTETDLVYTWMIAVWSPVFSDFLHNFLADNDSLNQSLNSPGGTDSNSELHIGNVFQQAIEADMHINSVVFREGCYFDIGTQENLKRAVKLFNPKSSFDNEPDDIAGM